MSITSTAFAQKRVAIIQIILPTLLQDMRADDSVLFRTPWAILTNRHLGLRSGVQSRVSRDSSLHGRARAHVRGTKARNPRQSLLPGKDLKKSRGLSHAAFRPHGALQGL